MWWFRSSPWWCRRGAAPCWSAHVKQTRRCPSTAGPTANTAARCTSTTAHTRSGSSTWPATWGSAAQHRTWLVEETPSPLHWTYSVILLLIGLSPMAIHTCGHKLYLHMLGFQGCQWVTVRLKRSISLLLLIESFTFVSPLTCRVWLKVFWED